MELFLLIIRLTLASVFTVAGVAKLMDATGAEKAAAGFGIPDRWAKSYAIALSVVEIAIAFLLLAAATSFYGAVAAGLLLIIFILGMAYQLIQGRSPDCHCFGQLYSKPVSKFSIFRNAVLIVLPLILVLNGPARQGVEFWQIRADMVPTLLGILSIFLLAGVISLLKKIAQQQNSILRRIELLELVSNEGQTVKREEAGDPYEGLPIGAQFPRFLLPDVSGQKFQLSDLTKRETAELFLFVGPNCSPCAALVPEIAEWRTRLSGKVQIVLFSSGTSKENQKKFGPDGLLLIDKEREIASQAGARWTPTALLVSSEGKVASHLAVGDVAIRKLVDKIEDSQVNDPLFYFASRPDQPHRPHIGKKVPVFSLTDVNGKRISHTQFAGRRTLVAFWSPACPHCREMLDSLKEWDANRTDTDPNLVVFSDGDVDEHRSFGLGSPVIIDKNHEVAAGFGMFGTPSAVLVDEKGTIVSETAIGARNIWALVGRFNGNGVRPHNQNSNGNSH